MFKKWLFAFALFFVFTALGYSEDKIPQPQGWVNDFAGVIDNATKEKLNSLINEVESKTSSEIAVVTIESITPYDENEYTRLLFDNWKPGKKGKDNGILILLAVKERRWKIETGYGVESILPDGLCGEIGRNYMVPYFKEAKYAEGLYSGVKKISGILTGETSTNDSTETIYKNSNAFLSNNLVWIFGLLALVFPWKAFFVIIAIAFLIIIFFRLFFFLPVFLFFTFILSVIKCFSFLSLISPGSNNSGSWGSYSGGFGGGFGGFGGGGGGGGGAGGGF